MLISKFSNYNQQLNELSERNNLVFDVDYIKFMELYNGGDTPKTVIKVGRKKEGIRAFYGFNVSKKQYSFEAILDLEIGEDLIEKKMFPIASNEYGDFYALDCSSEMSGVYVIRHDNLESKTRIAESFREFVMNCKSEKIGHIRTIEERKNDMIAAGLGDTISEIAIRNWQKEIDRYARYYQEKVII
ncbi:SMI1/KNR4 family protein [Butyrivibrio sp. INlla14]|uniref:SMI1/KNR4 family protein n=1 Tax=Butyrivibrio sp. INlla14 TaxID=1520808 RepID=UPI0008770AA2|nr:SMI1/KNR4 family protein [Butyrivibrio sp. INlla14]SCY47516.1 SMI1 / KNR4 family (SUKH-1) [Butyrivibrio sp. INlla14]